VLIDTSVWVDHLRRRNIRLANLLESAEVWIHPFVIGELACGNPGRRPQVIELLNALPKVPMADHEEVLDFVNAYRLFGRGLGWVDVHLLASAQLAAMPFWTLDKRLAAAARQLTPGTSPT
jgi:predicted nucleic acid-binding protein